MKTHLHPGAKWQFRISGYFLFGFFGVFLGIWTIAPIIITFFSIIDNSPSSVLLTVFLSIAGYLFLVIIASEIYSRMSYNRWFYEFTDSNLKLERGIIWKRYSNIPYERVQNVDIHRGILARIIGFSSVMIQTAGYSYSARGIPMIEGYIPAVGVNDAEKIRDFLMKKISKKSRSGI